VPVTAGNLSRGSQTKETVGGSSGSLDMSQKRMPRAVVVDPAHPFVEGDDGVGMPAGDLKEVGVVSGQEFHTRGLPCGGAAAESLIIISSDI
jgi:hypothetical protein